MKACRQTPEQSVLEHGLSVWRHTQQLIGYLSTGEISGTWRLPDWLETYREHLLARLYPIDVIEEYTTYHDCGKPYCEPTAERRFPDHAERSYETWLAIGGDPEAAELMRRDMLVHTMKAVDVPEFCQHRGAATLLIVGLAEIHANAGMFGGLNSQSFKIKWNHLDRRGKAICRKLFDVVPARQLPSDPPIDVSAMIRALHMLGEFDD